MLVNASTTQGIASFGWAHKGSLWTYRLGDAAPQIHKLSDAKYLTLRAGEDDFFSVVHNGVADTFEISAHHHSDPARRLSTILLEPSGQIGRETNSSITGDPSVWAHLPRAYVAYAFGDYRLFLVHPDGYAESQTFPWYTSSNYDKGYQGIVGVQELRDSRSLIVSVQRDSNPVVYDPENRTVVRKVALADRRGNPSFTLRSTAGEFLVIDYDTVVKLDAITLIASAGRRLQDGGNFAAQNVGALSLCRPETLCVVARPHSGDVIGLDCATLAQTHRANLGSQPLDAALLGDDIVVALDWKTANFLTGSLQKI
jgi:hypothetical protein